MYLLNRKPTPVIIVSIAALLLTLFLGVQGGLQSKSNADLARNFNDLELYIKTSQARYTSLIDRLDYQSGKLATTQDQMICIGRLNAQWNLVVGDAFIFVLTVSRDKENLDKLQSLLLKIQEVQIKIQNIEEECHLKK